jgi:hypothetical protein
LAGISQTICSDRSYQFIMPMTGQSQKHKALSQPERWKMNFLVGAGTKGERREFKRRKVFWVWEPSLGRGVEEAGA